MTQKQEKIQRNDPCPCGSGLKYKKCCEGKAFSTTVEDLMKYKLSLANRLMSENKLHESEQETMAVLQDNPFNDKALALLALINYKKGNIDVGVFLFKKAIAQNPNEAEYYYNLASLLIDTRLPVRNFEKAIEYLNRALRINSKNYLCYQGLGIVYYQMSEYVKAKEYFEKSLNFNPEDKESKNFLSIINGEKTSTPDNKFISNLFDNYAGKFDHHLTNILEYKIPKQIVDILNKYIIANNLPKQNLSVLDLGCGTGLCGEALKEFEIGKKLIGVDLSEKMLEKAEEKKVYDKLIVSDIEKFTNNENGKYEIVIAADVIMYMADLKRLFANISKLLSKEGVLIFNIENGDDNPPFIIKQSGRFAHAKSYIETLALQNNLELLLAQEEIIRKEGNGEINGYIIMLRK